MTLGHPRSIRDLRSTADSLQAPRPDFSSSFDAPLFVDQFLKRFGGDAEVRLGKANLEELESLSKERDPELFWEAALRLAGRLERGDRLDASAALFQEIAQATAVRDPELSSRAERDLKAISGEGEVGARFEFLLRRFARETRDPSMIVSFGVGSLAYRATKLGALSQLWSPGQGFFLGRTGAGLLASAAGLGVETPVFLFTSKLGRQLGGIPQDWSRETLGHELAGVGLTLFCLKGMGALSAKAVQTLGNRLPASGLDRFAVAAVPQAGMLAGIALARRLEESLGLRPRLDNATLVTDALSTYLQFFVSGRLAERALGPRFQAMQAALNWRQPKLTAGGGRDIPSFSLAKPLAAGRPGISRGSSIQELAQAPLLSGSYDDGGDGYKPMPDSLRYGYSKDTINGMWFPIDVAKPSDAVPMFTSAPTRIPVMLRSAYRYRPDRQYPRTILLEPGLEALQKISTNIPVTPEYLNSLTKGMASDFPDKTPFRIMQVAQRRTFTAQVTERNLRWIEESDPTWARLNRHSVSTEFDAETPLELYLYIESLTRQPKPSYQTDYRVRFQGRVPASYEVSFVKFVERSLKFYRVAGRSFSLEFEDGGAPFRFASLNGDWTLEESRPSPLPKPPAEDVSGDVPVISSGSPRPMFPAKIPANVVRKPAPISPFTVINSVQGLKDVAGLLSERGLPRRIELWLETPSNALLESESWQQVFKDLRPGSILVVHESQTRKSFTFQRREDQVRARSSRWSQPLAWEPGLPLSSRDLMDLFQALQFITNTKLEPGRNLTVSILGDWEPYHGKLLTSVLNQWGNIPFDNIEIQGPRPRSEVWLRLRRNHVGKFVAFD